MIRKIKESADWRETMAEIARLAVEYKDDLLPWADYTLAEFYRLVHLLPYRADPIAEETVSRPLYTMRWDTETPRDCDDKTVAIAAFCELKEIPWRLVACGRNSDRPHHVYPEIYLFDDWYPADATYPNKGRFGERLYRELFRVVFSIKKSEKKTA